MNVSHRKDSWRRTVLVMSMLAAGSPSAWAVKIDYQLGVSGLLSDNIGLAADNPRSEWVLAPTFDFNAVQEGSQFHWAARGNAQYLKYANGTFPDGPRGAIAAEAKWIAIPGVLEFVAADHLSRRPVDSLVSYTPSNDQQINVFVAGPTMAARIDPVTRLRVDLRFSNTNASKSHEIDGQRYDVMASVERRLSPNRTLSLSAESSTTRFSAASGAFNYDLSSGFIRYEARTRLTHLTADLGYSRVSVRGTNQKSSGPLFRLTGGWMPEPRHTLRARISQQYADTSGDVIARSVDGRTALIQSFMNAQGVVSPRVYLDRRVLLGYEYRGVRLRLNVDVEKDLSSYLDQTNNIKWSSLATSTNAEYRFSPRLNGHAYLGAFRRESGTAPGIDRNVFMGAGVAFRWTAHWTMRADLQHRSRRTPIHLQGFKENAIVLYFGYRP